MKYTLGIDLGTSYFKAGLFDAEGRLCGLGRVEVKKQIDDGVRFEVAIDDFWLFLQQAIEQAKTQASAKAEDITGMGYSSQANTFVLLNNNDVPLTPLIIWADKRPGKVYPEIEEIWNQTSFLQTSGIGIEPGEGLCINKLLWFQKNQPHVWNSTHKIMTVSDYLVYSLTGQRVGDAGTASLLGLLDINRAVWNTEVLKMLHFDENLLSRPMLPGTLAGPINNRKATERLGLPPGIPLVLGSLDHYMAAVGAGLGMTAQATISLGTVIACVNQTPNVTPQKGICIARAVGGQGYHQLAWDLNGAVVLEWYNHTFCPKMTMAELVNAAASVSADCDGLVAKPNANQYEGLEGFENIRKTHTHGHFARAIMQSTADTLNRLIGQLCPDRRPQRIAATGGGAKSELWMDMCSETLKAEVFTADSPEPACKGAAAMVRKDTKSVDF